jgi:hypothetical protein
MTWSHIMTASYVYSHLSFCIEAILFVSSQAFVICALVVSLALQIPLIPSSIHFFLLYILVDLHIFFSLLLWSLSVSFHVTIGHNTFVQYSGCTQLPFFLFS